MKAGGCSLRPASATDSTATPPNASTRSRRHVAQTATRKQVIDLTSVSDSDESDVLEVRSGGEHATKASNTPIGFDLNNYDLDEEEEPEVGFFASRVVTTTTTMKATADRKDKQLADFRAMLKSYGMNPTHDMVDILTNKLISIPDLRDAEIQANLKFIESLCIKRAGETTEFLDDSTLRLVEIISGKTLPGSIIDRLLHLVRISLGALTTGDEAILSATYEQANVLLETGHVCNNNEKITFTQVMELMQSLPSMSVQSMPVNDSQFATLEQVFTANQLNWNLEDAFEIMPTMESNITYPRNEPSKLFFHCTRNVNNIASILKQGLQVKGTGGTLGRAIYMADSMQKSLGYCGRSTLRDRKQYGVIFIVEAALGKTYMATNAIASLPDGYDSVSAIGSNPSTSSLKMQFRDGTPTTIPMPSTKLPSANRMSPFHYSEYTVYSPDRVRLRFMLLFSEGNQTSSPNSASKPQGFTERIQVAQDSEPAKRMRKQSTNANDLDSRIVSDLEAFQMQSQFKRKLLERRQRDANRYGMDSPEWARVNAICEELGKHSFELDFFKRLKHL